MSLVVGFVLASGLVVLVLALLYWLFIVGEGTYLGAGAVRLIYHVGAPHYDRVHAGSTASDQALLAPLLAAALDGRAQPRVLDVATGTGRVPLLIAARYPAARIVGLDLTPAMLARARAKQAVTCPTAPIEWQVAEAGRIDRPSASFDLVTCLEALEFFPRPRQAISEMVRVLAPGGMLLLSKYPDDWARLLPGRGLTRRAMAHYLQGLGLGRIEFHDWQPGYYELVLAFNV